MSKHTEETKKSAVRTGGAPPTEAAAASRQTGVLAEFVWRGNPTTKKNSQEIRHSRDGKPYIAQGRKFEDFEALVRWQTPWGKDPINIPVTVKAVFYRDSRRTVDLTNLLEAVDDILQDCGVIADDCRDVIASHDGSRVYLDRENPRTEITITALDEAYEAWATSPMAGRRRAKARPAGAPARSGKAPSLAAYRKLARLLGLGGACDAFIKDPISHMERHPAAYALFGLPLYGIGKERFGEAILVGIAYELAAAGIACQLDGTEAAEEVNASLAAWARAGRAPAAPPVMADGDGWGWAKAVSAAWSGEGYALVCYIIGDGDAFAFPCKASELPSLAAAASAAGARVCRLEDAASNTRKR